MNISYLIWTLVNVLLLLVIIGVVLYVLYLAIKALKIYIKKNS